MSTSEKRVPGSTSLRPLHMPSLRKALSSSYFDSNSQWLRLRGLLLSLRRGSHCGVCVLGGSVTLWVNPGWDMAQAFPAILRLQTSAKLQWMRDKRTPTDVCGGGYMQMCGVKTPWKLIDSLQFPKLIIVHKNRLPIVPSYQFHYFDRVG